MNTRRES